MGICPARVKKLQISTNICGEKLKNCNHGKTKSARIQKRNVFSTDKNEM